MKWRSTESPSASATLYPPWTMRVQPHLPSSPFTAIVTSSSGAARFACHAAKRPAPPEPRMRMSVFSRFISGRSHCAQTQDLEDNGERHHPETQDVERIDGRDDQQSRG